MTDIKQTLREGQALLKARDLTGAIKLFEQAALECEKMGDLAGEIELLKPLARIYELSQITGKAIQVDDRLLNLYEAAQDRMGQGMVLSNLGLLNARTQQYDAALHRFEAAYDIFEALGDTRRMAEQFGNIGSVWRDRNNPEKARQNYRRALALFKRLDLPEGLADQYTNMAYIHVLADRMEEALTCYRQALPLYAQAGADRKADATRQNLENLEKRMG